MIKGLSEGINWFPGHMRKALRVMQENVHNVDIFLEIRDARIPYCSRNSEFDKLISLNQKKKIILFNKFDLCDEKKTNTIMKDYNNYGIQCFSISSRKHDDMRKIIGYLKERYNSKYKQIGLWFMVCGVPNVGKSSIINQIRNISDLINKKATTKTTASVCTTKGINGFKILQNPLMFMMDSPGVMIPSVIPNQLGIKMAVLGIIKDQIVDKNILVQYIVEECEKNNNANYWKNFRIEKPKNVNQFLERVRNKHKLYDEDSLMNRILREFRQGHLGRITLDDPIKLQQ